MIEDDPSDLVHDLAARCVFGRARARPPVIGTAATVRALTNADIGAYHANRYGAGNVVVAAAGNVEHDAFRALVSERLQLGAAERAVRSTPAVAGGTQLFLARDTEQYHVCLSAPGLPRDDDRRFALALLDHVLGGAASSRLVQEIREQRGMAYSVYSYTASYDDAGQVGIYVGTRAENVAECVEIARAQMADFAVRRPDRRRARARQGERQGPHAACARVDVLAHVAARASGAERQRDPLAGRGRSSRGRSQPRGHHARSRPSCSPPSGSRPPASGPTTTASRPPWEARSPCSRRSRDPRHPGRRERPDGHAGRHRHRRRRGHRPRRARRSEPGGHGCRVLRLAGRGARRGSRRRARRPHAARARGGARARRPSRAGWPSCSGRPVSTSRPASASTLPRARPSCPRSSPPTSRSAPCSRCSSRSRPLRSSLTSRSSSCIPSTSSTRPRAPRRPPPSASGRHRQRRPDPLGAPARPRRPPGDAARGRGAAAHDPARRDLAGGLRAGRAAGRAARARAATGPDGRAGDVPHALSRGVMGHTPAMIAG